jgi:hypothetical protein
LKEGLKLKTENLEKLTFHKLETLDLVFNNTLIWVLNMIHLRVFLVWTFMLFLKDQEAELVLEEDANQESVLSTELLKKTPWNGLEENMMELSTIDYL